MVVIIKHNTPWAKPWYDRHSKELNPLLNNPNNTSEIEALENIVEGIPIVDDYSVNNSHGFLDYARHIASNIFSHVPTPVKMGFATGLLAVVAACSSGSVPTATPTNTPAPPSRATPAPTIIITFPSPEELIMTPQASEAADISTYKMIFPFKEPSSSLEEYVFNNTDVVTYMKFVRFKEDIHWTVSLASLVNLNLTKLPNFIESTIDGSLTPYVPLEDFSIFQQSQLGYQGTHVPAEEEFYQQGPTGELIPLPNPDIDKQVFEELKTQFSGRIQTNPLDWTMHKGPNNSGYIDVDVSLPLEKDWEIEIKNMTASRPAILGDRIYIGDEDDELYVLNAQNGDIEQRIEMYYGPPRIGPAVTEDILIVPL
ncbi:MAG: hypothetical protein IIC69_00310 [Nanoarchaeota archaeon]|nr:hypothetical protein [Nanoarchaeota archaeon]